MKKDNLVPKVTKFAPELSLGIAWGSAWNLIAYLVPCDGRDTQALDTPDLEGSSTLRGTTLIAACTCRDGLYQGFEPGAHDGSICAPG